jgi:hypothetical protein
MLEGPLVLGFEPIDFGTGRHVCPRAEVALSPRARAVIDTPDFYGSIGADARLFASVALDARWEVFAGVEAVRYQFVQNGTLVGAELSVGMTTVGAAALTQRGRGASGSTSVRLLLPTSNAVQAIPVGGLEVGHAITMALAPRWDLHAYIGADASMGFSPAESQLQLGAVTTIGVAFAPKDWVALVLDVNARASATRYVAPAVGVRLGGRHYAFELAATAPVSGNDRHDAIGALRFSYTW